MNVCLFMSPQGKSHPTVATQGLPDRAIDNVGNCQRLLLLAVRHVAESGISEGGAATGTVPIWLPFLCVV